MEQNAGVVQVKVSPDQGRVVSESELAALLKLIRTNRAMLNQMELFVEEVFFDRVNVPSDKKVVKPDATIIVPE